MMNDEQKANKINELSKELHFSLRNLLKKFGVYEANFSRIMLGECNVNKSTQQKLDRMLNFLERVFSLKTQMLGTA